MVNRALPGFRFDRDQDEDCFRMHDAQQVQGRRKPATSKSRIIMQKFALKLLLTSLIVRRGSKRVDGAQFAALLLTLVGIVLVGLYIWSHDQY
jgi:hypothetical protein